MKHKIWIAGISALIVICLGMMWWYNNEPDLFDPVERAAAHALEHNHAEVTGTNTTSTLIEVVDVMLNKRGGYLSNDILPPWVFLDNVPNWEFGVLTQVRDLARIMRNDFSRSQTQSTEDIDLMEADPGFHYANDRWFPPDTEGRYEKANDRLESYLARLSDPTQPDAQFYARADNLVEWLGLVEKRLGSLSQRLSASVGQDRLNTDLSGDAAATQSTSTPREMDIKTSWFEIDDVFYEARGTTWALSLIHI